MARWSGTEGKILRAIAEAKYFAGKVAVITGASAGIGREFATQLHSLGCKVILVARRDDLLRELAQELNASLAGSAKWIAADLTDEQDLQRVISALRDEHVDILINNAGRGSFGPFDELDLQTELQLIALNVVAPTRLCHAIIPQMKARRMGAIITVSSVAGIQPLPFMSTYAATKAYDLFHSFGLWWELRAHNIRALAVCPGPVATEFGGVARVPGTWTGGKRDTAHSVVKESLKALARDRAMVIPGIKSKMMILGIMLLPRKVTTRIVGKMLQQVL